MALRPLLAQWIGVTLRRVEILRKPLRVVSEAAECSAGHAVLPGQENCRSILPEFACLKSVNSLSVLRLKATHETERRSCWTSDVSGMRSTNGPAGVRLLSARDCNSQFCRIPYQRRKRIHITAHSVCAGRDTGSVTVSPRNCQGWCGRISCAGNASSPSHAACTTRYHSGQQRIIR